MAPGQGSPGLTYCPEKQEKMPSCVGVYFSPCQHSPLPAAVCMRVCCGVAGLRVTQCVG